MAPTQARGTNKRPRASMGPASAPPTTATPAVPRMEMQAQQRKALERKPPRHGKGDVDNSAKTISSAAVERLVDGLPGIPPRNSSDEDRHEDFESARKKFAMYGKQNEHVSHYSPLKHTRQRSGKRQNLGEKAAKMTAPAVRRSVEWEADGSSAVVLTNTLLLQENGELAVQLDDIEYHLDGILHANPNGIDTDRGYAMAQSVVMLTGILRQDHVQTVMKVARQSQQLYARLREVLLLLQAVDDHHMLKLSIAVLAYTLTTTADADEFFTQSVIDGIVTSLETESKRLPGPDGEQPQKKTQATTPSGLAVANSVTLGTESKTPLKKSFLKRKKSGSGGALLHRVPFTAGDASRDQSHREDAGDKVARTRMLAIRDEKLLGDLRPFLRGHDVFLVDGRIDLSLPNLLCMILHNILQVGGGASSCDGDSSGSSSFTKPQINNQQLSSRQFFHKRQDAAGTTFETIRARKQQLIGNGGLDLLLNVLTKRFDHLYKDLGTNLSQVSVSYDLASAFQRVRAMLRVLDQASFLANGVQMHMSKDATIFRVVIQLIETLSDLAWSSSSQKMWKRDPGFMQLVVDVLMTALRVLINLSHQNDNSNKHIAQLDGVNVLFFAFCKLWGTVELLHTQDKANGGTATPAMEEKIVYDAALLMLSAITNCVEYSHENRVLLSQLDLSRAPLHGLEKFRVSSVCSLLVAFFICKIQSYVHLIEMGDSQRELESESWVPEDVILGGCTSLLLGCLMKDSPSNSAAILGALPDHSPHILLRALSAFVALHSQIGALTPEVGKSVLEVEKLLKSFLFDQQIMITTGRNSNSSSSTLANHPPSIAGRREAVSAMLSIKVKLTPLKTVRKEFVVEEIKEDEEENDETTTEQGEEKERSGTSQPSQTSQSFGRSPPASAFKLKRFTRVCSNVDDSDDQKSDVESAPSSPVAARPNSRGTAMPTVTKSPDRKTATMFVGRTATKSPDRKTVTMLVARTATKSLDRKASTMLVAKTASKSPDRNASTKLMARTATKSPDRKTVTMLVATTPPRRVATTGEIPPNGGDGSAKRSTQRRLKRTRQLVSDLEAEIMKIGSRRVSSEIEGAAAGSAHTSMEDADGSDCMDFSQDLSSEFGLTPLKKKKSKSTTTASNNSSPKKLVVSPPLVTHKRKLKGTPPAKPVNKIMRHAAATTNAVFDFPG